MYALDVCKVPKNSSDTTVQNHKMSHKCAEACSEEKQNLPHHLLHPSQNSVHSITELVWGEILQRRCSEMRLSLFYFTEGQTSGVMRWMLTSLNATFSLWEDKRAGGKSLHTDSHPLLEQDLLWCIYSAWIMGNRQTQTHTLAPGETQHTHTRTPMSCCLHSPSSVLHVTGLVLSVISAGLTQSSLVRDKHTAGAPFVSHIVYSCPLMVSQHSSRSPASPFSSHVFPYVLFFVQCEDPISVTVISVTKGWLSARITAQSPFKCTPMLWPALSQLRT